MYSVRTQGDIISYKELKFLHEHTKNSKVVITLTREPENSGWTGSRGRINIEMIKNELKDYDLNRTKCYNKSNIAHGRTFHPRDFLKKL